MALGYIDIQETAFLVSRTGRGHFIPTQAYKNGIGVEDIVLTTTR